MPRFTTRLIDRTQVADGTLAFAFERPAGFEFTAGQYLTITLPDPLYNDEKGNSRTFSIASPPQNDGRLVIATRMTGSALKRSLAEAPLGTPVSIFGPAGDFTLGPDPRPVVFIAGGIGITPFRSMLLDAAARSLPRPITLIYSNRIPEGAPFHEELARLARTYTVFNYVPTMTEADKSTHPWDGERRLVNADFLHDHVADMTAPIFYLAGPPGLVVAATKTVLEAGADPAHLLSEEFSGYESRPIATAMVVSATAETAPPKVSFVKVAQHGDLAPGQVKAVAVNGAQIALCNVDGVYYAIDDTCPHRSASLAEGDLIGKEITCPLHGAIFDVTTGEVLEGPAGEGVTSYEVRLLGTDIEIKI
jgi:ferredoxin-NADP reductase